jgi:hypothetical protein
MVYRHIRAHFENWIESIVFPYVVFADPLGTPCGPPVVKHWFRKIIYFSFEIQK